MESRTDTSATGTSHQDSLLGAVRRGWSRAGGGDPVRALHELGGQVVLHVKDVDAAVLVRLRSGEIPDFHTALRSRIFTELGAGMLDVRAVLTALREAGYGGWLMVEQDTSWGTTLGGDRRRQAGAVLRGGHPRLS